MAKNNLKSEKMKKYFALLFLFYFYYFGPIIAQTTHYLSDGKVIFELNDQFLDITNGDSLRILKDVILIKYSENMADSVISNIENSNQLLRRYTFQTGWISYYIPDTARIINLATSLLTSIASSSLSFNYPLKYFSSSPPVPDDPEYQNQWYLSDIQVPEAWEITTGNSEIKIGVLDEGVDWSNFDLGPDNLLGGNFVGGSGTYPPYSYVYSHGNMVTSVIAAKTNNYYGTSGIAGGWNSSPVKIVMCKISNGGQPNMAAATEALDWALQQGIRLFNFSWGIPQNPGECSCYSYNALKDEIDLAYNEYGATMFSSTDNYDLINQVAWPACSDKVIGVGATDDDQNRWSSQSNGSNWGPNTDISAPGTDIHIPYAWPTTLPPGAEPYTDMCGTSCATAVAVGVAALMVSVNPCLSNYDIETILKLTADKTGNYKYNWDPTRPGHSQELGYGKINAYQAVLRASESRTEVASNENITFDTPKWFTHNLTLQSNSVLTITATVKFNQGCKIIVMPGAQLIINGGTLTTSCPGFWSGVEVRGNRELPQTPISNQGYLRILNGGKIEKADPGVYAMNGGIVIAEDAVFENNQRAAIFANYNGLNFSTFRRCSFKISNEAGIQGNPYFIGAELVKTIRVIGCTFENTVELNKMAWRFRGMGIVSLDADIHVAADIHNQPLMPGDTLRTMFKNLAYGFYCLHSGAQSSINVYDAVFDHNQKGAYLSGYQRSSYVSVLRSEFIVLGPGQPEDGELETYGVYLDRCSGYMIEENDFHCTAETANGYGLIINESGLLDNEVYNNAFHNLTTGSQAQGCNRYSYPSKGGLCYKCNDFYLNRNDILVVSDAPSGTSDQGISLYQGTKSNAAKNTFSLNNGGYDINNPFDQIEYWIDQNNGGYNTTPYPIIGVENNYIPLSLYNKIYDCPSSTSGTPDISVLREEKYLAEAMADSLNSILSDLVDGGSTEGLTTQVELSTPPEALETTEELLQKSPFLSDSVLSAAITKEMVLPNAMVRDILVENPQSAKSDALMEKLEERLIPMPDSMMAEIQQGLETIGAKEDVEHDIAGLKQQYENAVKQMIRIYTEDTTGNYGLDSLLVLVNGENKLHSAYDAVSLYLSKGAFSEGMALLNNIPSTFSLTPEQNSEYAMYQDLFPIVQQMISDSQGLGSVDSTQAGMLSSMTGNGAGPVAAYARNILIKRGTVQYEEPIINLASTKETRRWKINKPVAKKVEDWQIRLFPNPSRNFVIVEYRFSNKEAGGDDVTLSITDMNGHKVYDRKLIKSYDQVLLSTEAIQPGTYLVNLNRKGVSLGNTKLIIQK